MQYLLHVPFLSFPSQHVDFNSIPRQAEDNKHKFKVFTGAHFFPCWPVYIPRNLVPADMIGFHL